MSLCFRIPKKEEFKNNVFSERERLWLENGNQLLEKLIASCDGKSNPIRNFSAKELEDATNNYDGDRLLYEHQGYRLYKGNHEDRIILIKKFKDTPENYRFREQYINEIAILSQINHKNVVKLLGCCIETYLPIQVYEFGFKGFLSDLIHEDEMDESSRTSLLLSWRSRLRIAIEIAYAITYIHTGISKHIIHRDINSSNILLDEQNVAKLSGFYFSCQIPFRETHVEDFVRGSYGYLDPEYFKTSRVSEKSDVYGFGIILLELLTGQRAISIKRHDRLLLDHVKSFMRDNRLSEIVSPIITEEKRNGIDQQLQAFAELAMRCTNDLQEGRPTMMEVAKELRQITRCVQPR